MKPWSGLYGINTQKHDYALRPATNQKDQDFGQTKYINVIYKNDHRTYHLASVLSLSTVAQRQVKLTHLLIGPT